MKRVELLEQQQIALGVKLDNGIKARLDGVVAWQTASGAKIDSLANAVAKLAGMMEHIIQNEAGG
jgi:hypothetical protein